MKILRACGIWQSPTNLNEENAVFQICIQNQYPPLPTPSRSVFGKQLGRQGGSDVKFEPWIFEKDHTI
jgi:hypothetical protein